LYTVERIDDAALRILGNSVDGEVPARQILLERYIRSRVELEDMIAARSFALRTRERVFLLRLRMQENGKILANRFVSEFQHIFGCRTHDDGVAIFDRQSEQLVAH